MIRVFATLLFFSFFLGVLKTQTVISSCTAPDSVIKKYNTDADRMAVRRAYHIHSTYKDSTKINSVVSNSYLSALLAVYNSTALPARDTVLKRLDIHTLKSPWDLNFVTVEADSNLTWMKNIRNNVSPTTNTTANNLINQFYLQKINYYAWKNSAYHSIFFKTDSNINVLPLTQKFKAISGVYYSNPNTSGLDGPDILDSITPNFTYLYYGYKWSDCTIGCFYARWWTFKVYNDCSVEYVTSAGDPLPPNVGIKEYNNIFNQVKIYPNPARDILNLEFKGLDVSKIKLKIINTLGQIVDSISSVNEEHKIDFNTFLSGIYVVTIYNDFEQKSYKIIKE